MIQFLFLKTHCPWRYILMTILSVLFCHIPIAHAKPVALLIHVHDGNILLSPQILEFSKKLLAEGLPDHELVVVEETLPLNEKDPQKIQAARDSITEKLKNVVFTNKHKISHLVIQTHGGRNDKADNGYFTLHGLGTLGTNAADSDIFYTLYPLMGHLRKNATILLDACSTFCGEAHLNKKLVEELAKDLQVPNAKVFGPDQITADINWYYDTKSKDLLAKINTFFKRLPFKLFPALSGFFVSYPVLQVMHEMATSVGDDASTLVATGSIMAVTFTVLSRTLGKMLQKDSIDHFQEQHDKTFATKYSQGSLFQLKGGKVHKVTPLFKHIPADIPKIYNLKCKDALETITAS